jgi:hypothetical protein
VPISETGWPHGSQPVRAKAASPPFLKLEVQRELHGAWGEICAGDLAESGGVDVLVRHEPACMIQGIESIHAEFQGFALLDHNVLGNLGVKVGDPRARKIRPLQGSDLACTRDW